MNNEIQLIRELRKIEVEYSISFGLGNVTEIMRIANKTASENFQVNETKDYTVEETKGEKVRILTIIKSLLIALGHYESAAEVRDLIRKVDEEK